MENYFEIIKGCFTLMVQIHHSLDISSVFCNCLFCISFFEENTNKIIHGVINYIPPHNNAPMFQYSGYSYSLADTSCNLKSYTEPI